MTARTHGKLRIRVGRRAGWIVGLLAALALLTGCQDGEPAPAFEVTVTGEFGEVPQVTLVNQESFTRTITKVIYAGTGQPYSFGERVLADVWAMDLATGEVLVDTYSEAPRTYELDPAVIGPEIFETLTGHPPGSRVLLASHRDQILSVFDLYPITAVGSEIPINPGFGVDVLPPTGEMGSSPIITVTGTVPTTMSSAPIIRGPGQQIAAGQLVTMQFIGIDAATGEVIDSTWTDQTPFSAHLDAQVMPGWVDALDGQTVGSRVLAIIPPDMALGDDRTLIFVIDILDARSPNES